MDTDELDGTVNLSNEKIRVLLLHAFRLAETSNDISNLIAYVTFIASEMPEFKSQSKNFPDSQSQIRVAEFLCCSQATVSRRIKYVEKVLGR